MKRSFKVILLCVLAALFTFTACTTAPTESQNGSEALSDAQSAGYETSDTVSTEESTDMIDRTWPYVTGTFIQPWAFSGYTEKKWENHLETLLEAGIDTVIVQWSCTTPYGKFSDAYFNAAPSDDQKAPGGYTEYAVMIPRLLKVSEEMGVKVFLGLNIADEWWTEAASQPDWYRNQAEVGKQVAHSLYDLYKEKYPNAFAGWYFAWEYYNGLGYVDQAAEFLNLYLDELTLIDPELPLMLSPFVRNSVDVQATEAEWKAIFAKTRFREGDIFCCQDAVGAGHITIDQMDGYFAALKRVCDTVDGLVFWANNENFDQSTWTPAPLERFVRQMNIASKYVSGYVTFAYSHYYAPDIIGTDDYHNEYVKYYNTGSLD